MKNKIFTFIAFFFFTGLLSAQGWEDVMGMPGGFFDARHHPITFSIDEYGYVLGGSVNDVPANDFLRYDSETDTWENLEDFPGPARSFSYGTARGQKAYVGFGADVNFEVLKDFWEYDATTEEWTQLSSCPCAGRFHPAFIQLDEKIYVGMGNNNMGNQRDWWEYDIATDTWEQKEDLPGLSRHHPFYFGIDNVAYVGFGHGNSVNGVVQVYNDFYKFDPETSEWTQLNDFPGEGRVAGTQFDYKGKGYVLSGDGDNHGPMEEGEFWEYDPELDEWTQLESHPGNSRWAPGNFVIDRYVYFTSGLSTVQLESDLMRFELEPLPSNTDELTEVSISISPNPASNEIIFSQDISQFSDVRMVDGLGREVIPVLSNKINVSPVPEGIYYLQFFKNENMQSEKIVIMR